MRPAALIVFAGVLHAVPAAAQMVSPGARLLRVAAASSGVVLSVDSTTLARTGDSTFTVDAVYDLPADSARQVAADRQVESQEMDCARSRVRGRSTAFYNGDTAAPIWSPNASGAGGIPAWVAVDDDELPIFQAICAYLLGSFANGLPLTYELGSVDRRPELSNQLQAAHMLAVEYPRELSEAGITGTVQLRFLITAEGKADLTRAWPVQATRPEFAAASMRVLERMRFRPARKDGVAVPVWVTLPLKFDAQLEAPPPPGPPQLPATGRRP
jgi:TonB family protein